MEQPILNHIAYLEDQGETQVGEHQSRDTTKLLYFSCGCVVIAEVNSEYNPLEPYRPFAAYRHFTIPCSKHQILRDNNFSFPKLEEIRKESIRQSVNALPKAPKSL